MKILKDWWYAYRVLKKYNLAYSPFVSSVAGSYSPIEKKICVSPLNKDFISSFLHEVGHHVHNKNLSWQLVDHLKADDCTSVYYDRHRDYYKVLYSEAFASRFAAKTKRANVNALVGWFNSYSCLAFRYSSYILQTGNFDKMVSTIHRCTKMIEKP